MFALNNDPKSPTFLHEIGQIRLKGVTSGRNLATDPGANCGLAIADHTGGIFASGRTELHEDAWSGGGLRYLRLVCLLIWLVVTTISAIPVWAESTCETWNSWEFFRLATVEDVETCMHDGSDLDARDKYRWTPLHHAASSNVNPDVIIRLLDLGARLEARTERGFTPLHVAAGNNANPGVTTRLLDLGAELEARAEDGSTPLHTAAALNSSPGVIAMLVELGADLETRTEVGSTPLHIAASNNIPDMITWLVELGADLYAEDEDGWTPLNYAASLHDTPGVITRLIELGADGTAKTDDGETAWDLAQDNRVLRGTEAWWLLNDFRFK